MKHEITFTPDSHQYFYGDQELTSVTTLVKSITPPFDKEKIAARCAKRDRMTVEEVLAAWEAKGEAGRNRGTLTHQYAEDVIDGRVDGFLSAINERIPEMEAFDKAWTSLREKLDAKLVWKERIVGDPELGVAGRADVLLDVSINGCRQLALCDWKTGKLDTDSKWANLLSPFADVSDSELNRYSIQLSTYRLLLEREDPAAVYGDPYLIHLRDDGNYRAHRARDYRGRVLSWLTTRMDHP